MTKVKNFPKMNKAVYELLEIEEITLGEDTITVSWALQGDEEAVTSPVKREQYEAWLQQQGYLNGVYDTTDAHGEHVQVETTMSANDYWIYTDLTDRYQHMREFLATDHAPNYNKSISIDQLKRLAQTA